MSKSSPLTLTPVKVSHLEEDHDYDFGIGDEAHVRISMHETHEDRGAIWSRLTVSFLHESQETWPPMHGPSRVNLMRSDRGGMLGIQEQLAEKWGQWDWEHMLINAKNLTIKALEEALPMVSLSEAVEASKEAPFLTQPFIASSGVTVLYGDGGTGKSTLALALALEISSGVPLISQGPPLRQGLVLYADYEDDHRSHANRVAAIAKAHSVPNDLIDIMHLPMVGKVSREAKRLRKRVHDTNAALVILDSIGMGRGGDAVGSEDTIRMFRTLRSLNVPVLAIDHISKGAKTSRGDPDPYGSIYTRNSSRMMWFVEKRAPKLGDPWDYLVFTHTKANHVRKSAPQYLKLKYVNALQDTTDGEVELIHSIRFELTDLAGIPEADKPNEGGKISLLDEIVAWIWAEAEQKSTSEVADHFGKSPDTVRTVMNRGVKAGQLHKSNLAGENFYQVPDDDKPVPF